MTEDELVGWHHGLNGHEFEQAPEDGEGREAYNKPRQHIKKQRNPLAKKDP